ncbi:MAG: VanZ family protein, partial [Gemmataceae bacterium]
TLGSAFGVLLWLTCGELVTGWVRSLQRHDGEQPNRADKLLPAYVLLVVILHVLPLDLTLSPADIYRKFKQGGIRLLPFVPGPGVSTFDQIEKYLWQIAYFLPGGLLWAHRRQAQRWGWSGALLLGLAFAAAIEFLQLFVESRSVDVTDVLLGGASVLAGWILGSESGRIKQNGLLLLTACWLAAVLFVNGRPFTFEGPPRWPATWLPFFDYQSQNYFHALDQMIRKGLLFLPGGLLLHAWTKLRSWWIGGLLTLAFASVVECGQLFLPGRHFSVTDILVETAAGTLALALARSESLSATAHFPR